MTLRQLENRLDYLEYQIRTAASDRLPYLNEMYRSLRERAAVLDVDEKEENEKEETFLPLLDQINPRLRSFFSGH